MRSAPAVVAADTLLFDAASLMASRGVRHLPVVKSDGRVVGIVSDRDVRAAVGDPRRLTEDEGAGERARTLKVSDVMETAMITLRENEPMTSATGHFAHERIGALPVVDADGKLVGIVSYLDVLNALR
jgi:CBS domain-containing protein